MILEVLHGGIFEDRSPVRMHTHPGTELIFVAAGECSIDTGGKTLAGRAGCVFLIPAEQPHNQRNHGVVRTLYCSFRTDSGPDIGRGFLFSPETPDGFIERWMSDLVQLIARFEHPSCCGLLDSILSRIFRRNDPISERNLSAPIRKALDFMREHYEEPIGLNEVSAASGISLSYLKSLFRKEVGSPPGGVLMDLRLRRAEALLGTPYLRIAEIAPLCGFRDVSYFSRLFRLKYRMSPHAYRMRSGVFSGRFSAIR